MLLFILYQLNKFEQSEYAAPNWGAAMRSVQIFPNFSKRSIQPIVNELPLFGVQTTLLGSTPRATTGSIRATFPRSGTCSPASDLGYDRQKLTASRITKAFRLASQGPASRWLANLATEANQSGDIPNCGNRSVVPQFVFLATFITAGKSGYQLGVTPSICAGLPKQSMKPHWSSN
jgi:hypothetical protein